MTATLDPRTCTTAPAPATEEDRLAFWAAQATRLRWDRDWDTLHIFEPPRPISTEKTGTDEDPEYTVPRIEWFAGGRLNASVNCLDRHVEAGRGERVAFHFEGEPGDRETYTYARLLEEVSRAAHALESLGVGPGDRVVVYLPVIPETIVVTLACARIGAVHSLVFGGFSAEALRFRVEDTGAKVLVTTDGQFRRGAAVPVKANADLACAGTNAIEHVVVVRRTGEKSLPWTEGRDIWWHEALAGRPTTHTPRSFDAEHPLFIIYTSGTTGRPKGLVHTTGGYLTQTAYTHALLFGLLDDELATENNPDKVDATVHWCTADLAWVTAHTYEIYGPLLNGVTQVIYEGTPQIPHPGRHFEIIERYGVTNYYTAPTLVRSHMAHYPDGLPQGTWDLSSLRILGTVGESINPEAWRWLRAELGGGTLPVVDTWWQSETGSCVMSPRPHDAVFHSPASDGSTSAGSASAEAPAPKPGCATRALPGLSTRVVDAQGNTVPTGTQGFLVVDRLGPSMARTVWGDPERYLNSYFRDYAEFGWFFSGDGAKQDADGDIHLLGRVDDVINVSGHRLSTIELESALLTHPDVVEAGTAPIAHDLTGQAAVAFVVLTPEAQARHEAARSSADPAGASGVETALRAHVAREIGPIAKPAAVVVVPAVPKTRSGKIMRRLLTQLYEGTALGDTTSLQNEESVAAVARITGHPSVV
ncbi:acetate--CoA ligase [Brevibacterium samyangense]